MVQADTIFSDKDRAEVAFRLEALKDVKKKVSKKLIEIFQIFT